MTQDNDIQTEQQVEETTGEVSAIRIYGLASPDALTVNDDGSSSLVVVCIPTDTETEKALEKTVSSEIPTKSVEFETRVLEIPNQEMLNQILQTLSAFQFHSVLRTDYDTGFPYFVVSSDLTEEEEFEQVESPSSYVN